MDVSKTYSVDTTLTAHKVCQLINNGKVNDLPIKEASFRSASPASANYITACTLDSTHVLVAYQDVTDYYCKAVVLTITNGNITVGTPLAITSSNTLKIKVCAISSTKAVIAYKNNSSKYILAKVLTISGTTITAGTEATITSDDGIPHAMCLIDSTRILISYLAANYGNGRAVVLTISGTTVTVGTPLVLCGNTMNYSDVKLIDSTHAIVAFTDTNGTPSAVIITISGTTLTLGTLRYIDGSKYVCSYISVEVLDSTHALVVYNYANNTIYAMVLTISGTTTTSGTSYAITPEIPIVGINEISLCKVNSTSSMIVWYDSFTANSWALVLNVSGSTVTWGNSYLVNAGGSICLSPCLIDSTHIVVACRGGSTFGAQAAAFTIIGNGIVNNASQGRPVGIAENSTGTVLLKGISKGHTGLIAGKDYYYDNNGALSPFNEPYISTYIGTAISSTELYVPDYIIK